MNHVSSDMVELNYMYVYVPCTRNELYICTHTCICVVCTSMYMCICTCMLNATMQLQQLKIPFVFVAVFAGPEAIQWAHPTSEPCPSTPTVVKNGQLTCVSLTY